MNSAGPAAKSGPEGAGARTLAAPHAVAIGPVRAGDVAEVAALAASVLHEAWSEDGFARMRDAAGAVFLVARSAPEAPLAGFVLGQRVLDELHVLSLAVAPAFRRRGLARALVEAAAGATPRVLLEVRPSNAPARAFYGTLGFREVGVRKGYYPDGEDALLLTRDAAPVTGASGG